MKFNVRIGWSTDSDGDIDVNDDFEAENIQEAEEYVKRNYVNPEIIDELEDQSNDENERVWFYSYYIGVDGKEVDTDELECDENGEVDDDKYTSMTSYVEIIPWEDDEE